jgi:hypothetical protein
MDSISQAFTEEIPDGLIRIFLNIGPITAQVENDAPDFVDPLKDNPRLKVIPEAEVSHLTNAFEKTYPVRLDDRLTKNDVIVYRPNAGGIWFDVDMDDVKKIWLSEFNFYLESERPRYLRYFLRDVEHKIQWLQRGERSDEIRSISEFKKQFKPTPVTGKDKFDGAEVLKCADMLRRASQKIDLRTRTALVKFNTEKGRLEPLIIGMGDRLGYEVEALDKETIQRQNEKGNNVSHLISLK